MINKKNLKNFVNVILKKQKSLMMVCVSRLILITEKSPNNNDEKVNTQV